MLDHVKLTVSDLERSKRFYEQALAPLGYQIAVEGEGFAAVGAGLGYQIAVEGEGFAAVGAGDYVVPDVWLGEGDVTSPTHVAFRADRAGVDRFYEAALAAGGEDNGAPGVRPHYHETYYGAYVRDPDGHNLEAVCHEP